MIKPLAKLLLIANEPLEVFDSDILAMQEAFPNIEDLGSGEGERELERLEQVSRVYMCSLKPVSK